MGQLFIHVSGPQAVKPLVKVCRLLIWGWLCWMASLAWASDKAEQLFKEAQKAERDGQITRAYVLYAQAAAADPSNFSYWERAQALRPMASLMMDSKQAAEALPPDQVDRTLVQSIDPRDLEKARTLLPPPQLKFPAGHHDIDIVGDSKSL